MNALPHVTIIVLNWNGRSYLDSCLNALAALDYPQFDILLVDNASTDGSVSFVRQEFPQVNIMENRRNLGYAGGNNRALRDLLSEFAVLVNPDIVVDRRWLAELISPFSYDPTIAIAGCKLYFPGGKLLQHAGGSISMPRGMPGHRGLGEIDSGQYDHLADVEYVTGAAMAIRQAVMQKIGLFDAGFFMYFEEVDFCARARAAGNRVVYVPQATAVHDESAFAVRGSPSYLERFHTGRWRYLLKHFTLEGIVTETFPAEEEWLASSPGDERRAANRAYRTTLAGLEEIVQARTAVGSGNISEEQQRLIRAGLQQLRRIALDNPQFKHTLDTLEGRGNLEERPFTSTTAIIGPLLTRIRSLWAAVAVRESVSAITQQQKEFNQHLVQELREMESRLPLPVENWLEKDANLGHVKQQQAKVDAELARIYKLLETIDARIERLEKQAAKNRDGLEHDVIFPE